MITGQIMMAPTLLASVLGYRAHLRENFYLMILNLCSMYMTISRMYQMMGALWPKLAEQGYFMC